MLFDLRPEFGKNGKYFREHIINVTGSSTSGENAESEKPSNKNTGDEVTDTNEETEKK